MFNLNNSVDLFLRVLKTDILWIRYEISLPQPAKVPIKNAFEVLRSAQVLKSLPEKLIDPFNQKLNLFNILIERLDDMKVGFAVSECAPRLRNKKTGSATELVYDIADILWKI